MNRPAALARAPGALPLVGHLLPLWRHPLDFIASLPAHADLVQIRLGPVRAYVACRPELVHQVLMDPRTFDKGGPFYDKGRLLVGNGLATSQWRDHRDHRRLLQPAFSPARVAAYAAIVHEEITTLLSSWQPGQPLDVFAQMSTLTVRVTTRSLFSSHISEAAVADVLRCLPVVVHGVYRRMTVPFGIVDRLPTPANRRFEEARRTLRRVITDLAATPPPDPTDAGPLSGLLRDPAYHEFRSLAPEQIADHLMTLLVAGTETIADALAWTVHLLASHDDIRARLHTEVDTILHGRLPDLADLPRLDYTRRVYTETLRLYPPLWILTRVTTRDTHLGGQPLPRGTVIVFSPYAAGRNPDLFPNPDTFDPDRWLPDRATVLPRGAFVPFGAGNRKCIGDDFATMEAILTVAAIASRWTLHHTPGTLVRPAAKGALGTHGLHMIPRRRTEHSVPA